MVEADYCVKKAEALLSPSAQEMSFNRKYMLLEANIAYILLLSQATMQEMPEMSELPERPFRRWSKTTKSTAHTNHLRKG